MKRSPEKVRCIRCGCTEDRACPVANGDGSIGCSWVMADLHRRVGLCTACASSVELVFATLPPLDPDPAEEAQGTDAATIAGWLDRPVSTVRKALSELAAHGLALPVDQSGNTFYFCAPPLEPIQEAADAG